MKSSRFPLLLAAGLSCAIASCSTSGLSYGYRPPVNNRPSPSAPGLLVPAFRVRTIGADLTSEQKAKLQNSLFQTLGNTGLYSKVDQIAATPGADTLSIEMDVDLETRYTWLVAWPAIYPCVGYWPIQPYQATGKIAFHARGSIANRAFDFSTTREDKHTEILYGFYRKGGSTEMLTRNYDDIFLALRDRIAAERSNAGSPTSASAIRAIRNIAVLPFDLEAKEDPTLSRVVTDQMVTEFLNKGRYQVIEREQIDRILKEQGFQQSGACNTEGCLVQVGQLLGVDAMVSGRISRLGDLLVVGLRITDVAQGRILFARQIQTDKGIGHLLSTDLKSIAEAF